VENTYVTGSFVGVNKRLQGYGVRLDLSAKLTESQGTAERVKSHLNIQCK
jgi:hypothetical protein